MNGKKNERKQRKLIERKKQEIKVINVEREVKKTEK
jgi:hypothetical protein